MPGQMCLVNGYHAQSLLTVSGNMIPQQRCFLHLGINKHIADAFVSAVSPLGEKLWPVY
jgi:hypothetical protein